MATKTERIAAAKERLRYADSYTRLPRLLALAPLLPCEQWRRLLGRYWSICDNVGMHLRELRKALPAQGPVLEMMTAGERRAWQALPDRVTVYRGCGRVNMRGACWSLSRDVAAKFPTLHRYWQKTPLLLTATVNKREILAVKLDRGEHEIITFRARVGLVEDLPHG